MVLFQSFLYVYQRVYHLQTKLKLELFALPILDTLQKKILRWLVDIPINTKRLKD